MHCCHHCQEHAQCIDHVPIFENLSTEEKLDIAHFSSSKEYEKGEMIYFAGDAGGRLYVLYTGKVKLYRTSPSGKEQVLRIISPGDFLGELSLFSSLPLGEHAQALERSTMCVLDGARLKEYMAKSPSIAFRVMDALSRRLEEAENRIEAISLSSVGPRIAKSLLSLAQGKKTLQLPMSKGDFASSLGMSQETLSRKLAELQEEGLLRLKGHRTIILEKPDMLEDLSLAD